MRTKKIILGVFVLLLSHAFVFGQIQNIKEAINKAGRQRMLSQRIAKDYMLLGMNSSVPEVTAEMDFSIKLFEKQLEELLAFAPNEEIAMEFEKIKFSWSYFKKLIKTTPSKTNASKIVEYSNRLLDEANYAVQVLSKYSKKKSGKIIDISGRQRMLAQRIALYFAAYKWGVPNEDIVPRFIKAKELFESSLKFLMKNKTNTKGIKLYLKIVKSQFKFSRQGFKLDGDLSVEELFIFTNEITAKMNLITGMYEKALM